MSNVAAVMRTAVDQAVTSAVDAYQFYMAAADHAMSETARSALERLAYDQLGQARRLRQRVILDAVDDAALPMAPVPMRRSLDETRSITRALRAHLSDPHDERSALWLAMQRQLASMQLYEAWAGSATLAPLKRLYQELAEWESSCFEAIRAQLEKDDRVNEAAPPSGSFSAAAVRARQETVVAIAPDVARSARRRTLKYVG